MENEIKAHENINKDLISESASNPNTGEARTMQCDPCKIKNKEITSLKTRLAATESTIKDMEKTSISMKSDLYAANLAVKREQAINNQLIRFNGISSSDNVPNVPATVISSTPTVPDPDDARPNDNNSSNTEELINNLTSNEDAPPGPVVQLRKCRYEMAITGSCPFTDRPCKFSHDITPEDRQRHTSEDFCEKEFMGGKGSCPAGTTCLKNHNFEYDKLARGACIHELRRKNSCKHRACNFSHQIPHSLRGNTDLITNVSQAMKSRKNNKYSSNNSVHLMHSQKDICVDEFYGGKNSCRSRDCKIAKEHNLDWTKIKRGICLFEFFKKGSCTRRNHCHFNHQIPIECLSDRQITMSVLNNINRFNNKTRIAEVLGDEVVQTAIATSEITQQAQHFKPPQDTNENGSQDNGNGTQINMTNPQNTLQPLPFGALSNNDKVLQQPQPQPYPSGYVSGSNPAPVYNHMPPTPVLPNHQYLPSPTVSTPLTPFLNNVIKEMVSKESQKYFAPNLQTRIRT